MLNDCLISSLQLRDISHAVPCVNTKSRTSHREMLHDVDGSLSHIVCNFRAVHALFHMIFPATPGDT